jgi:hypothetical protein
MIRLIEMRQPGPMRIRPARAHENGLDLREVVQILLERRLHALGVARHRERVGLLRFADKGLDLLEWVRGHDVHGLDGRGVGAVEECLRREDVEIEDQEDKAVFSAVVGEGEFGEAGRGLLACRIGRRLWMGRTRI